MFKVFLNSVMVVRRTEGYFLFPIQSVNMVPLDSFSKEFKVFLILLIGSP